jgi:hypothetical protein
MYTLFLVLQNLLRTLRFCVALAAAMRRMALQNTGTTTTSNSSSAASTDSVAEIATYDLLVECYVENFLQDALKSALQSRGRKYPY